jgi:hypothetical protein
MFVEGQAYTLTQGRGLGAPSELLRVLATVSDSRGGGFDALAEGRDAGRGAHLGRDLRPARWDEPRRRLVGTLRARGIPLRVWVVSDAPTPPEPGPMASDPANFRVVRPGQVAAALAR